MAVNPITQRAAEDFLRIMQPVTVKPTLPKALRADDTCTFEGDDYKAELSYVVHSYGSRNESAEVELIWIEMDFGGSKCWTGDASYVSNDLEAVFTDHCREDCDRKESLRLADLKAGAL